MTVYIFYIFLALFFFFVLLNYKNPKKSAQIRDAVSDKLDIAGAKKEGSKLFMIILVCVFFWFLNYQATPDLKVETVKSESSISSSSVSQSEQKLTVETIKPAEEVKNEVVLLSNESQPVKQAEPIVSKKSNNHYSNFKEMQYVVENYQSNSNAMIIYNRFKELGHETAMRMVGICYAESSWHSKRANSANFDGSFDWGICQVNDKYHCPKALKINPNKYCYETLLDPVANADISFQIYKGRGNFEAWYARYRFGYFIDRVEF
jgi:hypothetical protein